MSESSILEPVHHDVYPFISTKHNLHDAAAGRVVLITGAGSGIGKATAIAFAEASARVIILVGRTLSKLEAVREVITRASPRTKVLAEALDVSDDKGIDALFCSLNSRQIYPDVLINNAGVHLGRSSVAKGDVDLWWRNWEIMLKGPYMLSRAFLRQMPDNSERQAAIAMVSSIGSYALLPESSAYGSSKAALNRLTEWIAAENRGKVQAVAFHPGGVGGTELTAKAPPYLQAYMTETAELAAGTALYLTTPAAEYLSGRYVDARWDMEELEKAKDRIVRDDLLKMSLLGDVRPKVG